MKAEELRIGNYLLKSLKSGNGRKINDKIGVQDIVRIYENIGSFNYEPIPLTDQWIEDLGFKEFGVYKYKTYYKDHIFLHKRKRGYVMSKRFKEPKYVHELQNIYFVLKGKQLIKK